ncbi:hypothetical protein C8N35_11242 [Breoghania corrubedonensis]|uniref:Secreted protein n=1 Tax=Breoghania corrubedonensis TaxID=665038 RepID=A0A2T5UW33_9HYPH|nr:hypothetical protein [Breoghania corrubedonensis]PTW55717.1 hypothetical protein C8N35_11242 [Breoghania corrubedonensis]
MFRRILLVASALALTVAAGNAETLKADARSGRTTRVGGHFVYNITNCQASIVPNLKVARQPAHGTVTIRKARMRVGTGHRCAGLAVTGSEVHYTAKRGYHGADTFSIKFRYMPQPWSARTTVVTKKYEITVH